MARCGCTATAWCAACYALAQRAGVVCAPAISERVLQSAVMQIARAHHWYAYHTHDSRKSAPGFPDVCLVKPPRLLFAELKRDGEKPTLEQEAWLDALRAVPGIEVYLWRPADIDLIRTVLST